MQRVLEVTSVDLSLVKTKPPQIHIVTHGTVPTSGWKHPRLSPWFYIQPPADGIQDFDFVADAPTGIVRPMITPIVGEATIPRDPADYWGPGKELCGVRIHARSNTKETTFGATEELAQAVSLSRGDGDPIPWLIVTATTSECDLIGKVLRIYHTGDALDTGYRTDRGNIELDPTTERVVRVWCG